MKDASGAQLFLIRIWCETRERPELPVELRGVIEHIPSGHKRYFTDLNEVVRFLRIQLAQQGILRHIEPSVLRRLWQRLWR